MTRCQWFGKAFVVNIDNFFYNMKMIPHMTTGVHLSLNKGFLSFFPTVISFHARIVLY